MTAGTVGVSITAGHIHATDQPMHPRIGQQIFMGDKAELAIHITADVARQWISVLETITEESN